MGQMLIPPPPPQDLTQLQMNQLHPALRTPPYMSQGGDGRFGNSGPMLNPQMAMGQPPPQMPQQQPMQQQSPMDDQLSQLIQSMGQVPQQPQLDPSLFQSQMMTPDRQAMIGATMDGIVRKINQGESGFDKGARVGNWLFGRVLAPAVAAFGGPGTSQAGIEMMQMAEQQRRQDKMEQEHKQSQYLSSLSTLGGFLQNADKTQLAVLGQQIRQHQVDMQQQAKMAQLQALASLLPYRQNLMQAQTDSALSRKDDYHRRTLTYQEKGNADVANKVADTQLKGSRAKKLDAETTQVIPARVNQMNATTTLRGAQAKTEGTKQGLNDARAGEIPSKIKQHETQAVRNTAAANRTNQGAQIDAGKAEQKGIHVNQPPAEAVAIADLVSHIRKHKGDVNHPQVKKFAQQLQTIYGKDLLDVAVNEALK